MEKIVTNFGSFSSLSERLLRVKDFSEYVRIFESDQIISFFIGDPFSKVYYDKVLPLVKGESTIVLGDGAERKSGGKFEHGRGV